MSYINSYQQNLNNLILFIISPDIAPVGKKTLGIMADGQGDDDEDEGVPEEKRLADDVKADSKVRDM